MKELVENYQDDFFETKEEELKNIVEEDDDFEELEIIPRKLYITRQDKGTKDLYRMISEGDIELKPFYQRKYVWSTKAASKFIESLVLNIPIPTIFVSESDEGVWEVVDGQQRLTAIKKFYDNELVLTSLNSLPNLNKKTYDTIDEKSKRILEQHALPLVIIGNDSTENIKFDIFMRINQGSVKLNEQELRNCLYRGPLMDMIHKQGNNEIFMNLLESFPSFTNRFQHLEIIERYYAMKQIIDVENWKTKENSYGGRIINSINDFLKNNRRADNITITKLDNDFTVALSKVYSVFGKESFRQYIYSSKSKINQYSHMLNRTVAELQLISLDKYSLEEIENKKDEIKIAFQELCLDDSKFVDTLEKATNNTTKVDLRYNIWGTKLDEVIQ